MVKISNEFLAVLLGKTADEIQELFKPGEGKDELTPEEVRSIAEPILTEKMNRTFNDGFNKAKSKHETAAQKAVDKLRQDAAAKLGVDLSDDFDAMLETALTKLKTANGAELTDVQVAKHPTYLKLKADLEAQTNALKSEYESFRGQVSQQQTMSRLREKAQTLIEKFNFDLPENAVIRQNLLNAMFTTMIPEGVKVDFDTLGNVILTDKDDNFIKDNLQNPIGFDDYFKTHASGFLQVKQSDNRQGTGNTTQPTGGNVTYKGFNFTKPKDTEEANKMLKTVKNEEFQAYSEFIGELLAKNEI